MKKKVIIAMILLLSLGAFVLYVLNGFGVVKGQLSITHTGESSWQISYEFDQPIIGIMTGPETKEYHETSWDLPEGFHFIKEESGYSWLEKEDKSSFNDITIDAKTYEKLVPYAPQPFTKFDHGVSINTGPLGFATKVRLLGLVEMMHNFEMRYSFKGLEDEFILVPHTSKTKNLIMKNGGSFVYFGKEEKVKESEQIQLILDDDFPAEFISDVIHTAEEFTTFYNKELGNVLENKLMIQMTYSDVPRDEGGGFSLGGGAQNGQFAGIAMGPIDSLEIDNIRQKIQRFMAHEMGHIWQSNLGQDNMRWINEGGAEILSHVGMKRLGMMTESEFIDFLNKYIAESIEDLKKIGLEAPHKSGYEQLNYSGGTIVLWAACNATGGDDKIDDIFDLYNVLNNFSQDSLIRFPKQCLLETFSSLGMKDQAINGIDYFINNKHEDPQNAYRDLFDLTGIEYDIKGDSLILVKE